MPIIKIKPLSVNDAWKGRRFKTDQYKNFEKAVLYMLPRNLLIPEGDLFVFLEWGLCSRGGDFDNPIKPFMDVLQKKYKFNDNQAYQAFIEKKIVKKGSEYIRFEIMPSQKIREFFEGYTVQD
jgi:hypothetical protein